MDTELVSMAQQFTGLPMNALIGAPLNAAAKANAAMAVTQTKFILDTCFGYEESGKKGEDVEYEPVMVKMTITRGVIQPQPEKNNEVQPPKIVPVKTTFDLPLLTIIPINSLGVDEVNITFEMEVKSSYSEEQTDETEKNIQAQASWDVKVGWGPISAEVKGSASYDQKDSSSHSTHYQKSNSAKYTVLVHAGQLPVPKGVNTIIEAYTNAIQPIEMPAPANSSSGGGTGGS
ncbi:DUF2589 domain-containing protein [Sinomicrobium weinanense]|uniref:DUF2589 domain-containing protein n=1 Tax=Sinomicrobium weinanense TaxID=2842200 RepID=A0A926JT42_9FLAO|nr:DUF2589 domain-containing protein [Sinomicrobium weinanense]MBC9796773.1 DUF2589 domain-containing protein [Sinomicrobium weinanense]MBU3125540.1 DUF2589 domain-containing protein [Sinomicrobium weinanense]